MKLAILCPTVTTRVQLRNRMEDALMRQINRLPNPGDVKILFSADAGNQHGGKSTGDKSNELMQMAVAAGAQYIARFDDDDMPGPAYIQRGMEVVASGMDCGELWGQIYFNSVPGNPFHHFLNCVNPATGKEEWWQDDKFYYRCPNHLNFIKLSLVKDIPYRNITIGEDGNWSMDVLKAGVLKTEYKIPEIIYHYFCGKRDFIMENQIMKQIYGKAD